MRSGPGPEKRISPEAGPEHKARSGRERQVRIGFPLGFRDLVAKGPVRDQPRRFARDLERVEFAGRVLGLPAPEVVHPPALEPEFDTALSLEQGPRFDLVGRRHPGYARGATNLVDQVDRAGPVAVA